MREFALVFVIFALITNSFNKTVFTSVLLIVAGAVLAVDSIRSLMKKKEESDHGRTE